MSYSNCHSRRALLSVWVALIFASLTLTLSAQTNQWLPATPEKLPRWRGFNLLEKFMLGNGRQPFKEEDFRLITKLGFNFVRLPMDYRLWIKNGNWEEFDESTLKEIDQAVEWGAKYHIHVWINFHRAPGYTVAQPPEKTSLWTDPETQRVCAKHWAMFARRYKGIPNERLAFDLMNEPGDVPVDQYVAVVSKLAAAIRAEDPNRLIISDGLKWGTEPIPQLASLHIAQATRGYSPAEISHYKASWMHGSDKYPTPEWPRLGGPNGVLLAPGKKEGSFPLVIEGPFATDTALRLHLDRVSTAANVAVRADAQTLWQKSFKCGPGEGEWKKAEFIERYKVYQNLYDRDYSVSIPKGVQKVEIRVTSGDWVRFSELGLKPAGANREDVLKLAEQFGKRPEPIRYSPGAPGTPFSGPGAQDRAWLWRQNIEPWKKAEALGIGVMVGEWGAFNKTPEDVFLRWAEDCLANWKQAGWGWAMWNFRGPFGVLDSGRADAQYEDFEGHKLDRRLLELLQRY